MLRLMALLLALVLGGTAARADKADDECYSYGQWKLMISACSIVIARNPRAAWAYTNRSNAYEREGDFDNALADSNKSVELAPKFSDAYLNRAAVYIAKKDYTRALLDLSKALELDGRNAGAYVNRGYIHEQLGDRQSAIEDYRRTLEIGKSPKRTVNLEFARDALKRLGATP